MKRLRVANVVGARPNFIKIAPILAAMRANSAFEPHSSVAKEKPS